MSSEKIMTTKTNRNPLPDKRERYIQPSILLVLYYKPSYGYELIQHIQNFGFLDGPAPPGMIYRHLRQFEEDSLVTSKWHTYGSGPAKRIYQITDEGKEVLSIWTDYLHKQVNNLQRLLNYYEHLIQKDIQNNKNEHHNDVLITT